VTDKTQELDSIGDVRNLIYQNENDNHCIFIYQILLSEPVWMRG